MEGLKAQNTFVTMFINLSKVENNSKRRDPKEYIKHAEKLLSRDIALYMFLEEDMIPLCKAEREKHNLGHKTFFKPISFEQLPYYPYYEKIKLNREKNKVINACGFKDTPSYITTVNSKIALVNQVIQENPFGSTHFAWIDFGLFHIASDKFIAEDHTFDILSDKIKLEFMQPIEHDTPLNTHKQYTKIYGMIAAGFMTGDITHWKKFLYYFEEEFFKAITLGYGPSEEQVFPVIMIKHPDFFQFYYGKYESILSNYQNQRTELQFIGRQIGKAKDVNFKQAKDMVDYMYPYIRDGYMQNESSSAYMGFLIQAFHVYQRCDPIKAQEVKTFFSNKTKTSKYMVYKNNI